MYKDTFKINSKKKNKTNGVPILQTYGLYSNQRSTHPPLVNVYRPPSQTKSGRSIGQFLDDFSPLLETISIAPGNVILVGDFNIHFLNKTRNDVTKFRQLL